MLTTDSARALVDTNIFPVILEAGLLVIFSLVTVCSVVLLHKKGLSTRAHYTVLSVSGIMFVVAIAHWFAHVALTSRVLDKVHKAPRSQHLTTTEMLRAVMVNIQIINFILTDLIITWRAWLIWDRENWVFIVSLCLCTTTFIGALVDVLVSLRLIFPRSTVEAMVASQFAILSSSITTNLWATSLMTYKTWQHRVLLQALLIEDKSCSMAEKVLSILVESGVIMSWALVVFMLSNFGWLFAASPYISASAVQICGIHWAIVVVFLCTERLRYDAYLVSKPPSLASLTPGSRRRRKAEQPPEFEEAEANSEAMEQIV
ncbi:hypothetical protein BV25DRAFT_1914755 [Artomyces pyxidatus]|uniref:Uncharacterized protein n=1 Tax=Artomyces pyxidatus TaxID=48021 RepID=A0ACB8T7K0_9AGAM|nr:hypothetical protein BV25DRAFT_1914755 [Artomyces pyxidatus]